MNWMDLKEFVKEEKAQGSWSSVYLILVVAIAVLILITVIKPMFQQSQQVRETFNEQVSNPGN